MNEAFVALRNVAKTSEQDTTTTTKSLNLVPVKKMKFEKGWQTFCCKKQSQPQPPTCPPGPILTDTTAGTIAQREGEEFRALLIVPR